MYKYLFCFVYQTGQAQFTINRYFNRYLTLDHEVTENDIHEFTDKVGKEINKLFLSVTSLTRISDK